MNFKMRLQVWDVEKKLNGRFGVVEKELKGEIERAKGMLQKQEAKVVDLDQENANMKANVLDVQDQLENSDKAVPEKDAEIQNLAKS